MTIGQRVLQIVKEKGKNQKDLAYYLGTSPSTINGWKNENRNPSSDSIVRICEFLDVSCEYLLTGSECNTSSLDLSTNEQHLLALFRNLPDGAKKRFIEDMETVSKYAGVDSAIPEKLAK